MNVKNSDFLLNLIYLLVKSKDNLYLANFDTGGVFKFLADKLLNVFKSGKNDAVSPPDVGLFGGYSYFYDLLADEKSKQLFLKLIAYKLIGPVKIKICDYKEYKKTKKKIKKLIVKSQKRYSPPLRCYDLAPLGYDIRLYGLDFMLATIVLFGQYNHPDCRVGKGDYVIDAGGCFGETALVFAAETGANGKVWTFEFSGENLDIMKYNLSNNLHISDRIRTVEKVLHEKSNEFVYAEKDFGISANVAEHANVSGAAKYETVSIDDFIEKEKISKIDFIKMDVEGSELSVLKGSVKTIKKHKPKLAVAVYHKDNDFEDISKFINELNLGYRFYLGNYSISCFETVLYAVAENM